MLGRAKSCLLSSHLSFALAESLNRRGDGSLIYLQDENLNSSPARRLLELTEALEPTLPSPTLVWRPGSETGSCKTGQILALSLCASLVPRRVSQALLE